MPDYMPPPLPPAANSERERLARIETMMEVVFKEVMGNGKEGLVTAVANHGARLKAFDDIYAAGQRDQGPLMQEWGAFKDKVNKLEQDVPGPKERRATGLAAYSAFAVAVITAVAGIFGIPLPVVK